MLISFWLFFIFIMNALSSSIGTETFSEDEYRFAIGANSAIPFESIERKVDLEAKKDSFNFPRIMNRKYVLKKMEDSFFVDTYFDYRGLLDKNRSSLRIRSRYKFKEGLFGGKAYRCEIQLKSGYELKEDNLVSVSESRIELRDFVKKTKIANKDQYLFCDQKMLSQVITMGTFLGKETIVNLKLKEFSSIEEISSLKPVLKLFTIRHRYHLEVENPWGVYPNPNQVLLISFDEVRNDTGELLFKEIEVERDRSTLKNLRRVIKPKDSLLAGVAEKNRKEALKALESDFKIVRDLIFSQISAPSLPFLPKNKRARMLIHK